MKTICSYCNMRTTTDLFCSWGQGLTGPSLWKDAECVHPSLKGVKMVSASNSDMTYCQILT